MVRTWLVSGIALGYDAIRWRWSFATDRIKTLADIAGLVPQLLRERKALFENAGSSPEKQLDFLLQLSD